MLIKTIRILVKIVQNPVFYLLIAILGILIILTVSTILILFKFKKTFEEYKNTQKSESRELDSITDLPNRNRFSRTFGKALQEAKKNQTKLALLFVDIDNFREIRDSLGFTTADHLLGLIAKRLSDLLINKKYKPAHIANDYFAVLLDNIHYKEETFKYIEEILSIFSTPFLLEDETIHAKAHVGVAFYPDDGEVFEDLLKKAGFAIQSALPQGKNTYAFYSENLEKTRLEKRTIEGFLIMALARKEFTIHYQPKVDFNTSQIIGAEALIRWNNPTLGQVSPSIFIPIAEQLKITDAIAYWVLKEACIQTKRWREQGYSLFSIAVNFNSYQFEHTDVVNKVANILFETGLPPRALELELTESTVVNNSEKFSLVFSVFKRMGIHIALDDFGTGHSSLAQLRDLSLAVLKIDQSFIKNLKPEVENASANMIVLTIIALAAQLGLKTVAEGVETKEQYQFLKNAGCNIAQGYLISKPIPAEEFTILLKKGPKFIDFK